jgi:hypothetical protein
MRLVKLKITSFIAIGLMLSACNEITKEAENWVDTDRTNSIPGEYHFLSDQGIKVFLPNEFKKYSLSEFQSLLDSLFTKKEDLKREVERLNTIKDMEGNLHIFYDPISRSDIMINTVPYFQFSKESASQLLGFVKLNQENQNLKNNLKFTKITAKFGGNSQQQIFKAIYKVENTKLKTEHFNTSYIISSNEKTIIIRLTTPIEAQFDPYIEKINM